jgi:hypothetical protein
MVNRKSLSRTVETRDRSGLAGILRGLACLCASRPRFFGDRMRVTASRALVLVLSALLCLAAQSSDVDASNHVSRLLRARALGAEGVASLARELSCDERLRAIVELVTRHMQRDETDARAPLARQPPARYSPQAPSRLASQPPLLEPTLNSL